jgi:hypothetical protein
MKLEQLYPDFMQIPESEQVLFIQELRKKRQIELSSIPTTNMSKFDISFSDAEKIAMKMLGLKKKDILALRAVEPVEEEQADLFDNEGLVEGDEIES